MHVTSTVKIASHNKFVARIIVLKCYNLDQDGGMFSCLKITLKFITYGLHSMNFKHAYKRCSKVKIFSLYLSPNLIDIFYLKEMKNFAHLLMTF